MSVPVTWVVVADPGRATIYRINKGMARLRELETLEAAGSDADAVPGASPEAAPDLRFAAEIGRHLEAGWRQGRFEALVLVASPEFLVPLRARLSRALRAALIGEIDHGRVSADRDRLQAEVLRIL